MSHIMETLLLLSLVVAAVVSVLPRRLLSAWPFKLAVVAIIVTVVDIVLGNWRWQIVPAYTLSLILLAVTHYRGRDQSPPGWRRKVLFAGGVLIGCVWLLTAVVLPIGYPMFESPAPSGPHGVGIMDIHLIDQARAEDMTDDPADRRELMVRVWYPASIPDGAEPEPFLREVEPVHAIFSRGMPLPAFTFSHLTTIAGHSYLNAPIADGQPPFPVLVFSHGNSFYASQNSLLMEHLASHGYVVFSIDHPYQASWVRFSDGRIVTYKMDWMGDEDVDPEEAEKMLDKYKRALMADSYDEYFKLTSEIQDTQTGANDSLQIWIDDTAFLLDQLAVAGSSRNRAIDSFAGRLDLDRIGIFGMSYGGATAGAFCWQDERCKAGINMDGSQFGDNSMDIQLERPFMLMNADRRLDMLSGGENEIDMTKPVSFEINDFVYRQSKNVAYSLTVGGSAHGSYSDFGVMSRLGDWTDALGTIDGWAMKDILNDYTLAFFNKHLKGTEEPLLDGPSDTHPDVLELIHRDGRSTAENLMVIE